MRRDEKATITVKLYPSTHALVTALRAKLHRERGRPVNQAEAIDHAVRRALGEDADKEE